MVTAVGSGNAGSGMVPAGDFLPDRDVRFATGLIAALTILNLLIFASDYVLYVVGDDWIFTRIIRQPDPPEMNAHAFLALALSLGILAQAWLARTGLARTGDAASRRLGVHRWLGRIVVAVLVVFAVITAYVAWGAIYREAAGGNWFVFAGFAFAGLAVGAVAIDAFVEARRKRFARHMDSMVLIAVVFASAGIYRAYHFFFYRAYMALPPGHGLISLYEMALLCAINATVLLLWMVYAIRRGILLREWVKLAMLGALLVIAPIAFVFRG